MSQVIHYLDRFYNTVIRHLVNDPLVHSEWAYFLTIINSPTLDTNRIELYLDILAKENLRKKGNSSSDKTTSSLLSAQNKPKSEEEVILPVSEIKFEKRLSQNWKTSLPNFQRTYQQPFKLRKLSSIEDKSLPQPMTDIKNRNKEDFKLDKTAPNNVAHYMATLGLHLKQESKDRRIKERHSKLCEISCRMVKMFEGGSKLRA